MKNPKGIEDRACCLECVWCQPAPLLGLGVDYVCEKRGKPLSQKRIWGRPCDAFSPVSGDAI